MISLDQVERATSWWARRALVGPSLVPTQDVRVDIGADGRIAGIVTGVPQPTGAAEPALAGGGVVAVDGVLAPGLVDAHVHLALDGGADVVAGLVGRGIPALTLRALANAVAQLRAGVTTVRDLGAPDDLIVALTGAGEWHVVASPRIVAAGTVTATAGHGAFFGRVADGSDAVRTAVREIAGTGATWIKVFASGGVVTPRSSPHGQQWFDDELGEAVATARCLGLRVAAHSHSRGGILAALRAGVDSVEHCSAVDAEVVDALRAAEIDVPVDGGPARRVSKAVSTYVATERFASSGHLEASRPDIVEKILAHAPQEQASLRRLVDADVPLVAGTDSGTTHNPHGSGLAEQAQLLVEAGASSRWALQAMTVRAGDLLGEPVGVIEPARWADLVTFDGDPTEDVMALARPLAVGLGGRCVTR